MNGRNAVNNEGNRIARWNPQITLGNALTIVSIIAAFGIGWGKLQGDRQLFDYRLGRVETAIDIVSKAVDQLTQSQVELRVTPTQSQENQRKIIDLLASVKLEERVDKDRR